ncbi:MAG: hypothetical protein JSU77_12245 [Fidelibacterota bacterium]|nr:MAG: hypothetical protein JSU77_12245 [Candidatus Neomarinimicrobiota bacterium]
MEIPPSDLDADSPEQFSEDLTPVEDKDSSTSEEHQPPQQIEFTRWQEGSLPTHPVSSIGHRRVIKSQKVHQNEPVKITHDITLEPDPDPEPEPESVEITPLKEGDVIVGLQLTCGCGVIHEVRFDYGDNE